MKIIDKGHEYQLQDLDGGSGTSLRFVKRVGDKYPYNEGPHPGTTSQEVLRALIDRVKYVQHQKQWHENILVLQLLRQALWLLEVRAKRDRGEFLNKSVMEFENEPICIQCAHVDCTKHTKEVPNG